MSIDVNRLSQSELADFARLLDEQVRARDEDRLYLYKADAGRQLDFHKSNKKIRLLCAGNRCLREDQRIVTSNGLISIGDIQKNGQEVLSFDQISNQFVLSQSSGSFAKGKSRQYRVVHENGEFVADERHQIFYPSGKYEFVRDVQLGDAISVYPYRTNLGQNPKESFSDVGHLTKTVSSFEDGCRAYNYLYDQRLHVFQVFVQEFFGRHIDVTKLFEPGGHELFEHLLLALLRSKHNRQDRLKIRTKNLYAQVLALGHSLSVEASSIFFWLLRHILEGNQSHELFPQTTTVEKIIERSVFSNKNNVYQDLPLNVTCSISRVIAVEKLKKEEWYWDMTVFGTHNYVTEDGAVNHNSGKSECSVMELLWLCLGTHPYHQRSIPIKAKIYFESYGTVSEVFEPKIMKWLPQKYLSQKKPFIRNQHGDLTGINFLNGSFIRVGTYDQQESKSEGSDWDIVVFDEPPPRPLYIANLRGVVDRGGLIWFAMTPLKEVWIYDELWVPGSSGKKPHVETFSWSTYDNPHIPKDEIDILVSELTQAEIDVRIYGKFKKLQGLVIDTYDAELSDIEPFDLDENFSIYEGIDPHPRKANTVLWKAIDKDGFRIVCRELACEKGIYDTGKEIARIRKELTAHGATLIRSIADSSLNQKDLAFKINQKDELNRSLIEEGETVMPETALKKDWLLPGIQKLRDLYRATNLIEGKYYPTEYVFNNCPRYKYELLHYQWSEKVGDDAKPISLNNDLLDPNRYIESIAPKFVTPGQSQFIRNNSGAYHRKRGMEIYLPNRK